MKKQTVVIAGSGKTSRANIEALMDDHYYANKKNVKLVLVDEVLSEAHVWAKQHAENLGIEVVHEVGFPPDIVTDHMAFFLLWNDEDPRCQDLLAVATSYGAPVFDLCDGLHAIQAVAGLAKTVPPVIPQEEDIEIEPWVEVEEDLEDTDDEDEPDPLYAAVEYMAEIFAEAIARKLAELIK